METITINKEQKLYVLQSDNGYSCLGFQVCADRVAALRKELAADFVIARAGSKKLYLQYLSLIDIVRQRNEQTGFKSMSQLIPEFIGREGYRVQIVDKYGETRRFIIGKSTGFIPCHLEILKSNSSGGIIVTGYPFKAITFLEKVK